MAPRLPHLARQTAAAAATALAAAALTAASAHAGTVRLSDLEYGKGIELPQHVIYEAAGGEANRLSLTSTAATDPTVRPQRWTLQDTGAPLIAGKGCTQIDAQTATCSAPTADIPSLDLFDGDDELTTDTTAEVRGGAGDDTIRFTADAGDSSSYVSGDAGDDLIDGALANRITADGGDGGDLLIGSTASDDLSGGAGTDELRGGNGNDRLAGNQGPDSYTCGAGVDTTKLDLSDRLLETIECESLELPTGGGRVGRISIDDNNVHVTGGVLTLGVRTGPRRSYDLQLRDTGGRLLGTGTLRTKRLRIRLTAAGIALLKPGARETVRLLTRPRGEPTAGPKTKPGVQLDLTIGT